MGYLFISVLILLIAVIVFSRIILQKQFQNIAYEQIDDKAEMVHKLIEAEIQRLVQINKDWGAWDETYLYVQGRNPVYKEKNLIPSSFVTLDIRFIIYYDLNISIIYAGEYEPEPDSIREPDNELLNKFAQIIRNEQLRNYLITGVCTIINNEPYLISAESILTSQHKGPLVGWLLMARRLDLNPIMHLTGISIDIRYDDSATLCALSNAKEQHITSKWTEKDRICASHKFYDVISQKMIAVKISEINELMLQGKNTEIYIIIAIIVFGFLIFHALLIVVNTSILKPIVRISKQLGEIDLNKTTKKIEVSNYSKEFSLLAEEVNCMLTKIDQQKKEIIESENRYRDLVENAEVGILIDDIDGNVVYFNDKLAHLFGYTPEEFKKLSVEDYIHPESLKLVRIYHRQRVKGEASPKMYEIKGIHKKGYIINLEVNTLVLKKEDRIIGTRNYIVDITERKRIEEKLSIESITDELTGLFNRRGFFSFAEQQVNLSKRTGKGFYIFYCDLNNMKQLNDRFGHSTGDIMLKQVANILKNSFRKSDIISRVGGDEFVVLANEAQPESINVMLNRLKTNIEKFNETKQYPDVSLSIGYAYFNPNNSKTLDDIINIADKMMYEEKLKFRQKN
ncbi:MAG: diguanylate cyclase [candidate division WOR-3 bacterium]